LLESVDFLRWVRLVFDNLSLALGETDDVFGKGIIKIFVWWSGVGEKKHFRHLHHDILEWPADYHIVNRMFAEVVHGKFDHFITPCLGRR